MFKYVGSREEEKLLLQFAIREAKYNKELIEELEKFEVETKKNGEIHKTKEKARLKLINDLKKENQKLKQFFLKHNKPEPTTMDEKLKRYRVKKKIQDNREHLYGIEEFKTNDKGKDS